MRRACIVGWAHTPFGKLEDPDVESLMARVSGEALAHAGIPVEQVDGIYVGVMNNGFSKQGFEAAQSCSNRACPRAGDTRRERLRNSFSRGRCRWGRSMPPQYVGASQHRSCAQGASSWGVNDTWATAR